MQPGGTISGDDYEWSRGTAERLVVERDEPVGGCLKQEAHVEPCTFVEAVGQPRVAWIRSKLHEHLVSVGALADKVVRALKRGGRNAE